MMEFLKGLFGLYLPNSYKVTNQTNVVGYKGPLFEQEFVWLEDANKEFDAWIRLGGYDTWFYKYEGKKWVLVKYYRNEKGEVQRIMKEQ